jgi:nucleotide-binding universal stress UspA family protein
MNTPEKLLERILVGVRLDPFFQPTEGQTYSHADEMSRLLHAVRALAHKTGASVLLVSICEANSLSVATMAPWLPILNWRNLRLEAITQLARKEALANSRRQLEAMAKDIGEGIATSTQVITAKYAAEGLLAEALANDASMIVLGSGVKADKYFTRGFSTPLAVMAESTVPVLVIGQRCDIDLSKARLRILIADDLREETARAMQASLDIASVLGGSDILHLHVEELSVDGVRRVLGQVVPELRSTVEWERLTSDLLLALETAFRSRLSQRIHGADERLRASGGSFRFELRRSPFVRDEIERAADEFGADLLIFGRHQKTHRRPYLVGRVTYQAMLSQRRAVLLIP